MIINFGVKNALVEHNGMLNFGDFGVFWWWPTCL